MCIRDRSFVVKDSEFDKLLPENHEVDLYLITYRVPGIERLRKPISMINLGPTPIDLIGFYRDIGLEAYMAHAYEEYNKILTNLQVRKAVANTKILILSNTCLLYTSYFCPETGSFSDYFPQGDCVVYLDEPGRLKERGETIELEFRESMVHRLEKGYLLPGQTELLYPAGQVLGRLQGPYSIMPVSYTHLIPDQPPYESGTGKDQQADP